MKVKAIYQAYSLPDRYVVKTMDDQLKMFWCIPYRELTDADLTPAPYYQTGGADAKTVPEYIAKYYGLEVDPS